MKFHEDRCKGEVVMHLKLFYLTARLQTDGRTIPNFFAGGIIMKMHLRGNKESQFYCQV